MTTKPEFIQVKRRGPYKLISPELKKCVEATIKALLHSHRDELRNQDKDTRVIRLDVGSGYVGEAFGILRGLYIQGFGYFGASNIDGTVDAGTRQPHQNLRWWLGELENEVLEEEGFRGDGICTYCKEHYHKDDASYYARLKKLSDGEPLFVRGRFSHPHRQAETEG